jgi:hypothetical protein
MPKKKLFLGRKNIGGGFAPSPRPKSYAYVEECHFSVLNMVAVESSKILAPI